MIRLTAFALLTGLFVLGGCLHQLLAHRDAARLYTRTAKLLFWVALVTSGIIVIWSGVTLPFVSGTVRVSFLFMFMVVLYVLCRWSLHYLPERRIQARNSATVAVRIFLLLLYIALVFLLWVIVTVLSANSSEEAVMRRWSDFIFIAALPILVSSLHDLFTHKEPARKPANRFILIASSAAVIIAIFGT